MFINGLLGAVLVMHAGCSGGSNGSGNGGNRLIPAVEAVQAKYGSLPLVERFSGVVKAKNQVEIFPEISAIVKTVHVHNGERVRQNQPLVSLRDKEFQERLNQAQAAYQITEAQARQAEARLKKIEAEYNRAMALKDKELSSAAEIESMEMQAVSAAADVELARARVKQALAAVAEAEEVVAQTVIRAPVDGVVGNRNAEIGMAVGPGTRLFTLGQLDTVLVEIVLTDLMLEYIEAGQRAEIQVGNSYSEILGAPLSRISPFLHPVTHSTDAEIELVNPDHRMKPGMFVTVDIFYGESEQAALIPLSALYENPIVGGTGIYVSRDTANRIPVEPMEMGRNASLTEPVPFEFVRVEVIARGRMSAGVRGLEPGSWVVTIGQDLLGGAAGQAKVRPVKWDWVERLQNLQREDLLQEIIEKQTAGRDSAAVGL